MSITTTIPTSRKLQHTKQRDPKPYIHIGRLPMQHHRKNRLQLIQFPLSDVHRTISFTDKRLPSKGRILFSRQMLRPLRK